jgi:hypothetical protein
VNHSKIAICVSVMNEVQFLFASKPCKPLKPRFLDVVFLVEKGVRVKRRLAGDYHPIGAPSLMWINANMPASPADFLRAVK